MEVGSSSRSTIHTIPDGRSDPSSGGHIRALVAGGVACAAIYAYAGLAMPIGNGWSYLARFLAAFGAAGLVSWVVWRRVEAAGDDRRAIRLVLGFALLFRLLLLPAGWAGPDVSTALARDLGGERTGFGKFLLYDNDIWRYVWEGHVGASGYSPYAFSPLEVEEDEALSEELLEHDPWWDVFDNSGFRALVTAYPPLAVSYFTVATLVRPGSVLVVKLGAVAADFAICFLLLSILGRLCLPIAGVMLWAWNPLVLEEIAGSGHFEPLMILPLLVAVDWATRGRGGLAAAALSVAALVKLSPLAVAPVLARRLRSRHALIGLAVLGLGVAPYWRTMDGWLETMVIYNREWHFNSGVWALAKATLAAVGIESAGSIAGALGRLATLAVMFAVWRRDDGSPLAAHRGAFLILAAMILLSPAVMPWYMLWALPFAVVAGYPAWAVCSVLSLVSYLFYVDQVELAWWRWLEYTGFAAAFLWQARSYRRDTEERLTP